VTTARSYFRRTATWFLLLAGVPAVVLPALFLLDEYRSGLKALKEVGHQLQVGLAQSTKEGFLSGESGFFEAPTAALLANPEVAAVVFRDDAGAVLYAAGPSREAVLALPPPAPDAEGRAEGRVEGPDGRLYFVSGEVRSWRMGDAEQLFGLSSSRTVRRLGTLSLYLSPRSLYAALRLRALQSLAAVALFLLGAALVAFYLARRVTAPVYDLVRGFQEVDAGNFHPEVAEPDEPILSVLVSRFHQTVQRVRELIREKDAYGEQLLTTARELEELNDSLERKIAERTHSLENAVAMLEYSNRKIQEADRLKSEFLANMSHELRTPLNAVIGFSELLLEHIPGPLTADQEQCLGDILHSGQHLLKLINEILDLSKVEAGKMPVNFTTRPMGDILDEVQALFRPLLTKKGQILRLSCPAPETRVYTDQHKLKQILINLLSNAHKFSPERAEITLVAESTEEGHRFTVEDRGIGIPAEHLEHIFDAFRQLDGSSSRVQEGTGLGLTLCRRFSELLGGTLVVQSLVGAGSTFTLHLPLDPSRPLLREEVAEPSDGTRATG